MIFLYILCCRFFAVTHSKSVQVWHSPGAVIEFAPFVLYRTFPTQYDDAICLCWSDDSKLAIVVCELYRPCILEGVKCHSEEDFNNSQYLKFF